MTPEFNETSDAYASYDQGVEDGIRQERENEATITAAKAAGAAFNRGVEFGANRERERIREALLSDGAIDAGCEGWASTWSITNDLAGLLEAVMTAALDHIGLGAVEESEK